MYRATIRQANGREYLVFPRSKQRTYATVARATTRLEQVARRGVYGQGRVYDTNNRLVWTIAL
jgi:hypothetical protein